jgi:hypothetical protein
MVAAHMAERDCIPDVAGIYHSATKRTTGHQ